MCLDARAIAESVGCLPLALDHAGAYVRTRGKTLADYRRLYRTHQEALLHYHSKLSDYDRSVLTAWEVNFAQVENDAPEAARLLLLFSLLDAAAISDEMLLRGSTPQKRWATNGEIEDMSPAAAGLDPFLIKLFSDELSYDDAVEKLLSFSLVRRNNDFNETRSISLHPLVQYSASMRVTSAEQSKWRLQAILLVCHAFPRNQYIEDTFGTTGRPLLPNVARAMQEFDRIAKDIPVPVLLKTQMTECCLAASRFLDSP